MGMWSKINTTPTWSERLTGNEDGKVVRTTSVDQDYEEIGVNPNRSKRLSGKERRDANRALRQGKQPRQKRDKK